MRTISTVDHLPRLGVIGIGAMGMAVARRALDTGFEVAVRDVRPDAEAEAAAHGAMVCASPAALAARSELVIILVVDRHQVEEVVFGECGIVGDMAPGGVVAVSSTIDPGYAESLGTRLSEAGLHHLDAPISGGPARARDGSMSMMAAADPGLFEGLAPVLRLLAARLFHVGHRSGDGARTKMLNNLVAGANLVAAAEALALGERLGLDPRALLEVMAGSSAQSWVMSDRMPRALAGDFTPRAAVDILKKDLGIAIAAGREAGFSTPMASSAHGVFTATSDMGLGGQDDAAVIEFYRAIAAAK
jgi:3-hydroxyisobutyrate dehydrogenase